MKDNKEVLKETEVNDSNLKDKKGVIEIGSTDDTTTATTEDNAPAENSVETITNEEPKSIALLAQEEKILNSVEVLTLEKMRYFAKEVVKSGVSSFKREADVILVLIRGKELGLPYGVSVNNIFAINGKSGLSVHLHKALLTKAGVYYELTEDNVNVYAYGKTIEGKGFVPMGTTTSTKVEGFQVSPQVIDKQTTYYFERDMKMPSGKWKTKKLTISYRYSEAVQAGLTEKEVWTKYTRSLMKARAFTLGSSEIASDVVQGMYGINELAMEFGKEFTINEDLEETIIDTEHEEV
jgi:hypothetical protein